MSAPFVDSTSSPAAFRPRFTSMALALLALFSWACSESVSTENLSAEITAMGPIESHEQQLSIYYALRDYEGDDQRIVIEICDEDLSECGTPSAQNTGRGGDGLSRLSTRPAGSDVIHLFRWDVGCGRLVGAASTATPFEIDARYVVRVTLATTSKEALSTPFSLEEVGFGTLPQDCP